MLQIDKHTEFLDEIDDAIGNISFSAPYQSNITSIVSGMERVRDMVEDFFANDVGEIVETIKDGKMKRVFSCCGTDFTQLTMWMTPNFCPECGAKIIRKNEKWRTM